jgi:hypothetical protein
VLHQTYPLSRMEWVLVDDSTSEEARQTARQVAEEGRAAGLAGVKLVEGEITTARMPLGTKRNLSHANSSGTILVYMDDDDYYPPTRVAHAVDKLVSARKRDPDILLAGSSEMHVWFLAEDAVYRFGPHGPRHATAATLAFFKELVTRGARFEDGATKQEEPYFLRDFTLPMVQLDPYQTILAISHSANTVDRTPIVQRAIGIDDPDSTRVAKSSLRGMKLLKKDRPSIAFYTNLREASIR